jgi:hypothetical protein
MIEERHVELIHAELDGELTSEQRAELSRVLLANPEARTLREQLSRLFGKLAKLEDAAAPPELAASVLNAIDRNAPTPGPALPARRSWFTGPAFRYAAVFVGGLALSAALLGPGMRGAKAPDVADLVGTIGGPAGANRQSPVDGTRIDLPQVSGTVNSYRLGTQLVLELDLEASEPVEVIASHGGESFHFRLGGTAASDSERLLWLPQEDAPAGSPIRLEVHGGGRLLHQASLRSAGSET